MTLTTALEPGWAVAVCAGCRDGENGAVPAGTHFDGPWTPFRPLACKACCAAISSKPGGYTAHPALQRCFACDARKPRSGFNEHNWMKLQQHGICEGCRIAYPDKVKMWRHEGLDVRTFGRVIGRLEGCPPPRDDPYAADNREIYWRVVYCPEPLPGQVPQEPEVLTEDCININGGRLQLRAWHGRQSDDYAFRWVEAYSKRWAQHHEGEPREVEWFTFDDVVTSWGTRCVICGGLFEHLDHWVSISAGGAHTLANVRPMCAFHNLSKGAKGMPPLGRGDGRDGQAVRRRK